MVKYTEKKKKKKDIIAFSVANYMRKSDRQGMYRKQHLP